MLQIVRQHGIVGNVIDRGANSWLIIATLQSQEQDRRRTWNRIGLLAQYHSIAIVGPATSENAVEQQTQSFLHARVFRLSRFLQRETRPGGWLDPGERALGPRPADQSNVDVESGIG